VQKKFQLAIQVAKQGAVLFCSNGGTIPLRKVRHLPAGTLQSYLLLILSSYSQSLPAVAMVTKVTFN